jgi:hypothetical protein
VLISSKEIYAKLSSEMEPPARESVKRMNPQLWTLGTSLICAKVGAHDMHPRNSIVSWQDDSNAFHLLPRDDSLLKNLSEGDSAIDLIQECGTNGSV